MYDIRIHTCLLYIDLYCIFSNRHVCIRIVGKQPVGNHVWEISPQVTADQQAISLLSPRDEAGNRLQAGRPSFQKWSSLGICKNARSCKFHSGSPWSSCRNNCSATVSTNIWKACSMTMHVKWLCFKVFGIWTLRKDGRPPKSKLTFQVFTPTIIRFISTNILSIFCWEPMFLDFWSCGAFILRFHFQWIRRHSFVVQWWKRAKCCHPNKHRWCWFVPWAFQLDTHTHTQIYIYIYLHFPVYIHEKGRLRIWTFFDILGT